MQYSLFIKGQSKRVLSRCFQQGRAEMSTSRTSLRLTDQFAERHIGVNDKQTEYMLSTIGFRSLDELIDSTIPPEIRLSTKLELPEALSETEALDKLRGLAQKNKNFKSFIGMGYDECITPGVIQRNILENPGWYTAYTPYQAEVAQGRLESLLNFQTMISDLTGLPIANASLLDEGTAAAEAMAMCHGAHNAKRKKFFVSSHCHPQTIGVMMTRAEGFGIEIEIGEPTLDISAHEYSGVIVQYPTTFGDIENYEDLCHHLHKEGCLMVAAADLLALTMLKSPGEFGADIAIGSAQRFGVPLMFGGPHAGFMAAKDQYQRKMPGRIIGMSIDSNGKNALRMAMQTREQHIRRDKATSNICTAQALLANMAASYGVYHGPEGLTRIAHRLNLLAAVFATGIEKLTHCSVVSRSFFDTVEIDLSGSEFDGADIQTRAESKQMNVRVINSKRIGVSFGETVTTTDIVNLIEVFGADSAAIDIDTLVFEAESTRPVTIPEALRRTSKFMTHSVFNTHHSETQMLRYLKSLEDKDLSLNTSMISLGSCTMKLNATSELAPISWPEFANIHPFVVSLESFCPTISLMTMA